MHVLTMRQKQLQQEYRDFAAQEIIPYADEYDNLEQFPPHLIENFAKKGYLGAIISKEYGGLELDAIIFALLSEELGKASVSLISLLTVHAMVANSIMRWGSEEQKKVLLPKLASGEMLAAFGLTEPDIGSDPNNIKTVAEERDDHFILNGHKKWISCAQLADIFLIFARCNAGITAFLVEKETLGFTCKPISGMLGFRSAMIGELIFENCKVSKNMIVGQIGAGFRYVANSSLDLGRYCVACGCVGLGQACLEACLDYTNTRKQGGVFIKQHQLIKQMIADMITEVQAARMLCFNAGNLRDKGDPQSIMETNIAKYFASKMANNVASNAVQIHGANGCHSGYPIQRYFRDAKITEIIEGSSQIQQIIISQYGFYNHSFKQREIKRNAKSK